MTEQAMEKFINGENEFTQFTLSTTLMGKVVSVQENQEAFWIEVRSKNKLLVYVGATTEFKFIQNLDDIKRDREPTPESFPQSPSPSDLVKKYIKEDRLVVIQGVYTENVNKRRFDARIVNLAHSSKGGYVFEETHWWLTQIARFSDTWLGFLFPNKQSYEIDDFALYQTNLNIIGLPGEDNIQECATLSRLIYGLSSAYLLTGCERYLSAARAAVNYQRETFRSLTHDGKYCFWVHGKRKLKYSYELHICSLFGDDKDTIPLYEQIYALSGLAQYYRITLDWEVLDDIKRTVRAFNEFFLDKESQYGTGAYGDYFSHLDYVTMSWDSDDLAHNKARKNWNSIGDHIPAYLINVILALEPLPKTDHGMEDIRRFLRICKKLLHTTSQIIFEKFPAPDSPFVNERFFRDWTPDHEWRWQQNRAIVGHNLKIAWNLTRVANYYYFNAESREEDEGEAKNSKEFADKLMGLARKLGSDMAEQGGVDLFRGGIFDAVERKTGSCNGMHEFVWSNTKDFWQQEQGILAYLILHGCTQEKEEYLALAQETEVFWNLFFLDLDNKGIYFRVTDSGMPVIQGDYANKGGHAVSGYHAFELSYLAHIYTCAYVTKKNFTLYFKPDKNCRQKSVNVLPDFFKAKDIKVARVTIDGSEKKVNPDNFQIELGKTEFELGAEAEIIVEFEPKK